MTAPPLKQAVEAFSAQSLSRMLMEAGVAQVPKSKDEKVELWTRMLADPARIRRSLGRLSPRCLKALQMLQGVGGEMRTNRYQALLEQANLAQADKRQTAPVDLWYQPPLSASAVAMTSAQVLATLLLSGLVWSHTLRGRENTKIALDGGLYVYIPQEIGEHLPPALSRAPTQVQVGYVLSSSARRLQRDLFLYWSTARRTALTLTAAGQVRMSDLRRLAGALLVGETITAGGKETDYRRLFFLRRLMTSLSLLQPDTGADSWSIVAMPGPTFLDQEPTERVRACYESWLKGLWWNELWATYVPGHTRPQGTAISQAWDTIQQARGKVVDALIRECRQASAGADGDAQVDTASSGNGTAAGGGTPIDGWIAINEIVNDLQDHDLEFLISREMSDQRRSYYPAGYPGESPYQHNALSWSWDDYVTDSDAAWLAVEGAFIRAVLTEGLFWMGLVDLGYEDAGTLTAGSAPPGGGPPTGGQVPTAGRAPKDAAALRLTEMGRWLLLDGPRPSLPAASGRVVLQPNFVVFAFDPVADSTLVKLDGFAARVKSGRAVEYELTRESVYQAQLAGQTVAEIRAWLEETTGAPLPQNVARTLEEWQAAYERILVRTQVALVRTAAPALADALMVHPTLRDFIIKRLGPAEVLVKADQAGAVEAALLADGELPVRTASAQAARGNSIVLDGQGRVTFVQAVPSLYIYGYLHALADETAEGWRVTPGSVRRAVSGGLDAPGFLGELAALARGGVPEELQRRVKSWARHFGGASLQTLTLLQFRDQQTLNELCADAELAGYLRPFAPQANLGMAVVSPEDVEVVRRLLEERGVAL